MSLLDNETLLAATTAALNAAWAIEMRGTPTGKSDGPPYGPPWTIIDTSRAEPEVNWPGDLPTQRMSDIRDRLARHRARAFLTAFASAATATELKREVFARLYGAGDKRINP